MAEAVTDEQGRFRVVDLLIGEYEVQVSHPGFQTILRKGILLTVGSDPVVDFSLPIGQAQEAITVQGEVSQIETQSVSLGALVESTQMRELPLNGRSYTQLMALNPGVTQITDGAPGSAGGFAGQGTRYSISGSRPNGQAWILDGQDLLGYFWKVPGSGATGNALGVEAIAEFQTVMSPGNGEWVAEDVRKGASSPIAARTATEVQSRPRARAPHGTPTIAPSVEFLANLPKLARVVACKIR